MQTPNRTKLSNPVILSAAKNPSVRSHAGIKLDSSPSLRMTGREMFISPHHPKVRRWFAVSE